MIFTILCCLFSDYAQICHNMADMSMVSRLLISGMNILSIMIMIIMSIFIAPVSAT